MKKVLVASPTANVKDYCFPEWISRVLNLTYGNYDIHLVDNSTEDSYIRNLQRKHDDAFTFNRVSPLQHTSFRHALAKSHDKCREKVVKGGYDYLLHLETDVIPPIDVIERLMEHNKKVAGALYHIEQGEQSKLMVQMIEGFGSLHRETYNLNEGDLSFVDGELKQVFSCGLGCVLIHRSVLEEMTFRYEDGASVHPDSIFYGDLNQAGISAWVDTSILCEHKNQSMTRV